MKIQKPQGVYLIDLFFGIAALIAFIQFILVLGSAVADLI